LNECFVRNVVVPKFVRLKESENESGCNECVFALSNECKERKNVMLELMREDIAECKIIYIKSLHGRYSSSPAIKENEHELQFL